jgi:P-type Ca2+ transporter type 2C
MVSLAQGLPVEKARLLSFISLVIGNLGLIFTNRSWTRSILTTLKIPNKALWWVTGGALGFLMLVSAVPFLRDLFKFQSINPWEFIVCLSAGLVSIIVSESVKIPKIQKLFSKRKTKKFKN